MSVIGSPDHIRIVVEIFPAPLVHIVHQLFCLLVTVQAVNGLHPFYPKCFVGIDVRAQCIREALQNGIGGTSYNDKGFGFGLFPDERPFQKKHPVGLAELIHQIPFPGRKTIPSQAGKNFTRDGFLQLLQLGRILIGLLRQQRDDVFIVEPNMKILCKALSNLMSAAPEGSPD